MIVIISPAKLLDFKTPAITNIYTIPDFIDKSAEINKELKLLKAKDLVYLQNISFNIASENVDRNIIWHPNFDESNAKQAILAFNGAVYGGINANDFSAEDFEFAQNHLRILSGLYGILRPLDLIQPYRLEMGTKLSVGNKKDLYYFWKNIITEQLNQLLDNNNGILINLASKEYFKAIDVKKLNGRIITPEFKNNKNGTYKTIVMYAKQARGMMCRFIIENKLNNFEDLQAFDIDGYYFNNQLSEGDNWIFTRDK